MQTSQNYVRFEVSTAVTMMIIIFWEMTPCGSYKLIFNKWKAMHFITHQYYVQTFLQEI
jgi:hypothetical protein